MSASWRPQTRLVHGGVGRSPHGETSEALFLTSGFCYQRAEDAEARFAETQEGYTYSRVGNPTVRMLEERDPARYAGAPSDHAPVVVDLV